MAVFEPVFTTGQMTASPPLLISEPTSTGLQKRDYFNYIVLSRNALPTTGSTAPWWRRRPHSPAISTVVDDEKLTILPPSAIRLAASRQQMQNLHHFFKKAYVRGYWRTVATRYARSFQALADELVRNMEVE